MDDRTQVISREDPSKGEDRGIKYLLRMCDRCRGSIGCVVEAGQGEWSQMGDSGIMLGECKAEFDHSIDQMWC
jgi:hypothetical protein